MFYIQGFNSLCVGGQERIDPRCNMENKLKKIIIIKIGKSGGGGGVISLLGPCLFLLLLKL